MDDELLNVIVYAVGIYVSATLGVCASVAICRHYANQGVWCPWLIVVSCVLGVLMMTYPWGTLALLIGWPIYALWRRQRDRHARAIALLGPDGSGSGVATRVVTHEVVYRRTDVTQVSIEVADGKRETRDIARRS